MNIFREASIKIRSSYVIIPIVIVFFIMFLVSCALMFEDYTTSRLGYMALPTRKANDWVIPLVALLPQLGQVGFGFVFLSDTNKKWSGIVVGLLWLVDVFTDVVYKAGGLAPIWVFGATIETITIYSIGSELMLATSIGMLSYTFKDFVKQLERMFHSFAGVPKNRTTPVAQQHNKPKPYNYAENYRRPPVKKVTGGYNPLNKVVTTKRPVAASVFPFDKDSDDE